MRLELIRDFSHRNHNPARLPISPPTPFLFTIFKPDKRIERLLLDYKARALPLSKSGKLLPFSFFPKKSELSSSGRMTHQLLTAMAVRKHRRANSGNRSRTCYLTGYEPGMIVRFTLPQLQQPGSNRLQSSYEEDPLPLALLQKETNRSSRIRTDNLVIPNHAIYQIDIYSV